jgi:hypothetical protein
MVNILSKNREKYDYDYDYDKIINTKIEIDLISQIYR